MMRNFNLFYTTCNNITKAEHLAKKMIGDNFASCINIIKDMKSYYKEDLKIIKGEDKLNSYQFKTKVAKHYFCTMCGIHTHNLRRADPNTYGINVACLDGIDPQEIFKLDVGINDGHNHIMDQKK